MDKFFFVSVLETHYKKLTHKLRQLLTQFTQFVEQSPEIYINAIKNYLDKLYPDGAGYWVVSPESKYESNKGSCITKLEANLLRYQYSLRAFRYAYPKLLQPPVLFAYRWREYNPETKEETGFYPPASKAVTNRIQ